MDPAELYGCDRKGGRAADDSLAGSASAAEGAEVVEGGSAGIIPPDAENLLSYAIKVSNAGIHGQEVEGPLAEEAWFCAVQGLAQLAGDRETPG